MKENTEKKVLTGEEARRAVSEILVGVQDDGRSVHYPTMVGTVGYFRDTTGEGKNVFSAFDNMTGDCWCEDFKTQEGAEKWCRGEMSTDEVREMESNIEEIILSRDSFPAIANTAQLTPLECKMLEWANVDIDHAEVKFKNSKQFRNLMEESEKAFVALKESRSVSVLTERQKAILQEDVKYWGVDVFAEIIKLDKEIIKSLNSSQDGVAKDSSPAATLPPHVEFDENGEMAIDMQFHDGYAFETNPHGLGMYDRIALYYPTIVEVAKSPEMQDEIEDYTGRRWAEGSKQEQIYDIALKFGEAGRLKCPQERFDAAVKAIVERAADPSAKAFTPEQREKVQLAAACNGEMFYAPGSFREVFYDSLFSHAQQQMQRVPIAWANDAHQELRELAHDEVRDQGLGLRR